MTRGPAILILGAGIVGASIAFHLARAGARVTLIARPGSGPATAGSFGWINASYGNPAHYVPLRLHAMAQWHRLADDLPGLPWRTTGGLCFDDGDDTLRAFARQHAEWGYDIREVGRAEIARIEPALARPPALAMHVPAETAAEPAGAARLLVEAARAMGARLHLTGASVRLRRVGDRVMGVELGDDCLAADEVVLAAGTATASLAAEAGVALPMDNPPGLLIHTEPAPPLLNGVVLAPEAHMRQTVDGRIVAGADFAGGVAGEDRDHAARALFASVRAALAGGDRLRVARVTVAARPTPIDGLPVIGRPPELAGLTLAVMHSGVTLAPAVGQFLARELLDAGEEPLLAPFRPARFSDPSAR